MNELGPTDFPPACRRVHERLDELLDGGLDPLDSARDAGHLEACARCAAERERLLAALTSWRARLLPSGSELARATEGLAARLARASEASPRRAAPARTAGWAARPARAAAIAASALLALLALQRAGAWLPVEVLFGSGPRATSYEFFPRPSWPADLHGVFGG